jgi:hypothetical protein
MEKICGFHRVEVIEGRRMNAEVRMTKENVK